MACADQDGFTGILAPLTAVTDLPSHPTLSRPYTSKTLTDLAAQGCDIMHKENSALWKVKHLQTKLTGDHIWVPCELMIGPNDLDLYRNDYLPNGVSNASVPSDAGHPLLEGRLGETMTNGQPSVNGEIPLPRHAELERPRGGADADADTSMADADTDHYAADADKDANGDNSGEPKHTTETEGPPHPGPSDHQMDLDGENPDAVPSTDAPREHATNSGNPGALAYQNRLQAPASTATSTTSEPVDDMFIHPLFIAPRSAHPDRDMGIPEAEADDVRRLLQVWVQKQEEVCRGAKRLYEGLLRADRLRKTVRQWSKYEAHVGPNRDMSDGEDWYDKEEWGLDEDLKKGQDEEEEDTTQTTKKTRTRR